jgi:hypothetical protein
MLIRRKLRETLAKVLKELYNSHIGSVSVEALNP